MTNQQHEAMIIEAMHMQHAAPVDVAPDWEDDDGSIEYRCDACGWSITVDPEDRS